MCARSINQHLLLTCPSSLWRHWAIWLNIGGPDRYNYSPQKFVGDHARVPSRVMVTTESFPHDSFTYWDAVWKNEFVIGE